MNRVGSSYRDGHSYRGGPVDADGDELTMREPAPSTADPVLIQRQRALRSQALQTVEVQRLLETRKQLPVYSRHDDVLRTALGASPVSVIGGETGSGKTTQVPQFLLDELLDRPDSTGGEIIVTQPRRLAAISVAQRVAHERGERLGDSIGYQVKLEKVIPTAPCRVLFCTTGILLRRLSSDGGSGLSGVVHIVVDEVHERDINTDFLIVLIARMVRVAPRLRVTLMSATLNADLFAAYFRRALGGRVQVPILSVQGKMYPVQEIHLEEALQFCDLAGAPEPPRRAAVQNYFSAADDDDESPETSVRLLRTAASYSRDPRVGGKCCG